MIALTNADATRIPLKAGSCHLAVCSPPYFGLRRYDAGPGEIGSEPTPAEFVAALVAVGREVWRVLRDDAVWVVNLGDSYNGSGGAGGDYNPGGLKAGQPRFPGRNDSGLKQGDKMLIPHRVALALQADGWTLRDEIVWRKKSAMPESVNGTRWERCRVLVASVWTDDHPHPSKRGDGVNYERDNQATWTDCPGCEKCRDNDGLILRRGSWRTTQAHEFIFVFSKGPGYFADREAVKTESRSNLHQLKSYHSPDNPKYNSAPDERWLDQTDGRTWGNLSGANPRSVMTFKATPFKGAHYATFPTTLPEFFIRAYTPEAGVCSECGEPWARVVESTSINPWDERKANGASQGSKERGYNENHGEGMSHELGAVTRSLGFRRTCTHDAPAIPATVLDPFVGSGSTLIAARALGRSGIGIDLSFDYLVNQARERLGLNAVHAWENGKAAEGETDLSGLPMFAV